MTRLALALLACLFATAGCSRGVQCPTVVEKRTARNGCRIVDGGMQCHFDFLQPETWGRCIEVADGTLVCQKGSKITHYNKESHPDWHVKAGACPALAKQVSEHGQNPEIGVEIQVAPPPPADPAKRKM